MFCPFSLHGNTNFHRLVVFGPYISEKWNYRMIPFYGYVLCIGILLYGHANDVMFWRCQVHFRTQGAAVAEWLSSWLGEQEDRGSIPGLAT